MYKIEKNVKVSKINKRGRRAIYPWEQMEVGDSFFVPVEGDNEQFAKKSRSITATASARFNSGKGRYITRTLKDGIRVWRVE